jgi:hypothetical protein
MKFSSVSDGPNTPPIWKPSDDRMEESPVTPTDEWPPRRQTINIDPYTVERLYIGHCSSPGFDVDEFEREEFERTKPLWCNGATNWLEADGRVTRAKPDSQPFSRSDADEIWGVHDPWGPILYRETDNPVDPSEPLDRGKCIVCGKQIIAFDVNDCDGSGRWIPGNLGMTINECPHSHEKVILVGVQRSDPCILTSATGLEESEKDEEAGPACQDIAFTPEESHTPENMVTPLSLIPTPPVCHDIASTPEESHAPKNTVTPLSLDPTPTATTLQTPNNGREYPTTVSKSPDSCNKESQTSVCTNNYSSGTVIERVFCNVFTTEDEQWLRENNAQLSESKKDLLVGIYRDQAKKGIRERLATWDT